MDEDNRRHLLEIWRKLPPGERQSWLQYGDFLLSKADSTPPEAIPEPKLIPGPPGETTLQAIKRLRRCYAMMEADTSLLDDATQLMTQRIMGARDGEIVPKVEALFEKKYRQWLQAKVASSQ